jgi:hypothetical protein
MPRQGGKEDASVTSMAGAADASGLATVFSSPQE